MTQGIKRIAKGTKVYIDGTLIGLIEKTMVPARQWEVIESEVLDPVDPITGNPVTIDDVDLGDEVASEWSFTEYWDPAHSKNTAVEDAFNEKVAVPCELRSPAPLNRKWTFSAKIISLGPLELTKKGHYKREVKARRVGQIVMATVA